LGLVDRGELETWRTHGVAKRKIASENTLSFTDQLGIPDRPGQYELRAIITQAFNDVPYHEHPQTIIASYIINVSP